MKLEVGGKALVPGYTVGGAKLVGTVTRVGRKTVAVEITVPSTGVKRVRTFPIAEGYVEPYIPAGAAAAAEGFHHMKFRCPECSLLPIPLVMTPSEFARKHMAEVHGRISHGIG